MEISLIILLVLIALQTSFITYKQIDRVKLPSQSMIVDTSVLIDGRIIDIARSGLLTANLIVPKSVVDELQFMADKADHDKRERARFGLDAIDTLKSIDKLNLQVINDYNREHLEVDAQLTKLANEHDAKLLTIDYNLNKAATALGVMVVNVNDLAHALRVLHLPGEEASVKLVQAGQEKNQAVGYLDDGTMVVVDEAKSKIGQQVLISVTRVLQTAAGKMMFATLAGPVQPKDKYKSAKQSKPSKPSSNYSKARKTKSKFSKRSADSNLVDLVND